MNDEEAAQVQRGPGASIDVVAPLSPRGWLRYDVIERMMPEGITDILEIGCGQGALGARLARRWRYVGVEQDRTSWSVAQRRIAAVGSGEVRNVEFHAVGAETFDLVCAFEVLEHLEDDLAALKEWAAFLRPGGWLLLSVPAHQRRLGPWDELVGHFRRYDTESMTALLSSAGFTDVEVREYGFPLDYVLESVRNQVARRRMTSAARTSFVERTASSGRQLQPSGAVLGPAVRWTTAPFRLIQRAFPNTGTGIVARARLISS